MRTTGKKLQVHHAKNAPWKKGLREYFEYRDLGLSKATGGKFFAHVLRARRACSTPTGKHRHDVGFHWAYVLRGWIEFEFAGTGKVRVKAGGAYYMPKGIHHEVLGFSKDFEQIEMHSPGKIGSVEVPDWKPRPQSR